MLEKPTEEFQKNFKWITKLYGFSSSDKNSIINFEEFLEQMYL